MYGEGESSQGRDGRLGGGTVVAWPPRPPQERHRMLCSLRAGLSQPPWGPCSCSHHRVPVPAPFPWGVDWARPSAVAF